jgi:1,4-dihydroxy-2-naphthoate octaprenyltransferase
MLTLALILSKITPWLLTVSIVFLIIGAVVDFVKKKFHWLKIALVFFVVTILLLVLEITLAYNVSNAVLKTP